MAKIRKKILVVVGSTNPVKIGAVKQAFGKFYSLVKVKSAKVKSGVPDQPLSFNQAYKGALNRAKRSLKLIPLADFAVGLEGTLSHFPFGWTTSGVVVILNKKNIKGIGISAQVLLPQKMVKRILQGKELGLVLDEISGEKDIKKGRGAFGFFTDNIVTRQQAYSQAVALALSRFINSNLF